KGAAHGKRVQAQGGAKNRLAIVPEAAWGVTATIVADSAHGCAGQRCLAASNIITIGARKDSTEGRVEPAKARVPGLGLDEKVEMGPVTSAESKSRVEALIQQGVHEGGNVVLDGRSVVIPGFENGNFIAPTVLENIPLDGQLIDTEIFGPV